LVPDFPTPFQRGSRFLRLSREAQDTKIKNEKRKATGSGGANNSDGGTNDNSAAGTGTKNNGAGGRGSAGGTGTKNNGAGGPQVPTIVLNGKAPSALEVQEATWQQC